MVVTTSATLRRLTRAGLEFLPKGRSLPEDVWRTRHRMLSYLLRAHVVVVFLFSWARGEGLVHSAGEAAVVALFALLGGTYASRRALSSAMVAIGLVASSALLVHAAGGSIEMHFHFFVMVGILTLYQDWLPLLLAIGFVVLHHGVLGTIDPEGVYNHPAAAAHPFTWAAIHGGFVLAASVASIVAWRLNEEQALKDSLTRLPNRTLFQDRVGHALARVQRQATSLAVLFVDLDGFKDVNDGLGHAAGDQLLRAVAERMRASVRPADTVARLGGDEFAVLVEDIAGEADAVAMAERLLQALTVPFVVRGREVAVGASVGIALNGPAATVEDMLRDADVAMYRAKSAGRGGYEVFEAAIQDTLVARLELERDLQRAVEERQFVVHYQPLVSLTDGRLVGVEALVRWNHPRRGFLPPADFLEVAEQTGAIVPLGALVLHEACRQGRQWKDVSGDDTFTISVNLSPRQLADPGIVETVRRALRESGLGPSGLVLELTEGILVGDSQAVVDRLFALKALGVRLAIDDFGTGYSSLSYLRRLPFDILKIDKQFVDGVAHGTEGSAFARVIINLARSLRLETVAEGVEDGEQGDHLRQLGCELAQGYHFARPMAPESIEALLGIPATA
jgi:diguanylate cyclase (GGDEF)-like protein